MKFEQSEQKSKYLFILISSSILISYSDLFKFYAISIFNLFNINLMRLTVQFIHDQS